MVKAPFGAAMAYAPLPDVNVLKRPSEPSIPTKAETTAVPLLENVIVPESINAST